MAEESPRPEEDDSEEEEGEEAAEAPVKALKEEAAEKEEAAAEETEEAVVSPEAPEDTDTEKRADSADPPPAAKEESSLTEASASSRLPLLPTPPTFRAQISVPTPPAFPVRAFPAVSSAYYPVPAYSTPPVHPAVTTGVNVFANDGSFLELFKKKMEAGSSSASTEEPKVEEKGPEPEKRKPISFVGKRRGAKLALKTGMVAKKPKTEEEEEVITQKGGAWAQYMAEVKKYKAHQCSDDDKTRPLVK